APKVRVTRDDLYGAVASFWLVFLSCLPVTVPFLVISEPIRALRVSNALLIVMLFTVGRKWAQYAHTNRLLGGLIMVAIGLALVGIAVLLQEAHAPRHVEDRRRHEQQAGDQTAQDRLRIRKDGLQRRENAAGAGRAGRGPAL